MQLVQGYSLKIDKALETDTGTYTCRICNSDGVHTTASHRDGYDYGDEDTLNSNSERNECEERSAFLKILGILTLYY